MSNSFPRRNGVRSVFAVTTLRKIRRLVLALASVAVLVAPVLAQHGSSTKRHNANQPKQKKSGSQQKAPRSLPNSAVPQVVGTKRSGSLQELDRIEGSSVRQARSAVRPKNRTAPVSASHASTNQPRSTPLNFSYQRPRGATKESRPPGTARTR